MFVPQLVKPLGRDWKCGLVGGLLSLGWVGSAVSEGPAIPNLCPTVVFQGTRSQLLLQRLACCCLVLHHDGHEL